MPSRFDSKIGRERWYILGILHLKVYYIASVIFGHAPESRSPPSSLLRKIGQRYHLLVAHFFSCDKLFSTASFSIFFFRNAALHWRERRTISNLVKPLATDPSSRVPDSFNLFSALTAYMTAEFIFLTLFSFFRDSLRSLALRISASSMPAAISDANENQSFSLSPRQILSSVPRGPPPSETHRCEYTDAKHVRS